MEFQTAHDLLASYTRPGSELGLTRMRVLLSLLGDPQEKCRFVHVAGTNGKGSTCAMLESVLRRASYHTGLYTSPALRSYSERIRIDGQPIPDEELLSLFDEVGAASQKLPEKGQQLPTEFEFTTAAAFLCYARHGCDIVILEVGMGGRLDATNVIPTPEVAIIAAIGLDHTKELGSTLALIAGEKAAIIKGGEVVSYGHLPEADEVIEAKCRETGAHLTVPSFGLLHELMSDLTGQTFLYKEKVPYHIPLFGPHQLQNASVVLETIGILRKRGFRIPEEAVREGLEKTVWAARLQVLSVDPVLILDGAHNPHGVKALVSSLSQIAPRWNFLCGILADKNHKEMLTMLAPLAHHIVTTAPPNDRALSGNDLESEARSLGIDVTFGGSIADSLEKALALQKENRLPLCLCGSLYMAGEILTLLGKDVIG